MTNAAHGGLGQIFGGLAVLLVAARTGGHLAARFRLPAVLGELSAGLALGGAAAAGVPWLATLRNDPVLAAFGEFGVLILMFEVGLESEIDEMRRVGTAAIFVAVTGVLAPLLLGAGVSALFGASESIYVHLFVGATLAATSVGITARVLQDIGRTQSVEAKIILAAAVVDDVLGLLLLAVIAAFVRAADRAASVSTGAIALIMLKALGFLALSLILGRALVPRVFALAARIAGKGLLVTTAIVLLAAYSYAAEAAGLAPAVGAFLAGLSIRPADYEPLSRRGEGALEEPLAPLSALFVPLFFVLAGARVDLGVFRDARVVGLAAVLTAAAIVGKLVSGLVVRPRGIRRWAIGIGMVPRGEVGLIFASVGASLTLAGRPVISRQLFAAVVVMVVVTSLLPPLVLGRALRERAHAPPPEKKS